MKRINARTLDRAADASLLLIVAAHILLALSFVAMLFVASGRAQAEAVCTGSNLMPELQASDPGLIERMKEEAAATPNGKGLLWKIEKPGVAPSFLFATMHMTDPRVIGLTPPARAAFDAAATVVIETTDVLDPRAVLKVMAEQPDLMMFTGSETLSGLLDPAEIEAVKAGLEARGIPFASVARMKPWMLSAMVALPACEIARKNAGAPILDLKLAADARAAGKPVEGLETIADQLGAMASLPMEFHVKGLVDTLKLGDRVDDVIETMIVLYAQGDTGLFWPLFRAVLPSDKGDESGYAAFEEAMVNARNRTMVRNAAPIIDRGDAFIAVGALHLPGENGLVELLRKAGYTVSPAG